MQTDLVLNGVRVEHVLTTISIVPVYRWFLENKSELLRIKIRDS